MTCMMHDIQQKVDTANMCEIVDDVILNSLGIVVLLEIHTVSCIAFLLFV